MSFASTALAPQFEVETSTDCLWSLGWVLTNANRMRDLHVLYDFTFLATLVGPRRTIPFVTTNGECTTNYTNGPPLSGIRNPLNVNIPVILLNCHQHGFHSVLTSVEVPSIQTGRATDKCFRLVFCVSLNEWQSSSKLFLKPLPLLLSLPLNLESDFNVIVYTFCGVEWTLYEQVAIAAMDCQSLDVAKVYLSSLMGIIFWLLLCYSQLCAAKSLLSRSVKHSC